MFVVVNTADCMMNQPGAEHDNIGAEPIQLQFRLLVGTIRPKLIGRTTGVRSPGYAADHQAGRNRERFLKFRPAET